MKIYLDKKLLLKSVLFPSAFEERRKRIKDGEKYRDNFTIYTWNSFNRLRGEYDNIEPLDQHSISVFLVDEILESVEKEFNSKKISFPEKIIHISSYHSFVFPKKDSIDKLISILENRGIDCLINQKKLPVLDNIFYASPNIERKIENSLINNFRYFCSRRKKEFFDFEEVEL